MAYTRVNWEDLPSTNTPINATNLNNMDAQIKENDDKLLGTKPMGSIVVDDVNCKNLGDLKNFTQTAGQSSTYLTIGSVYLTTGTYTLSWTQSASMTSNSRNTPGYFIDSTDVFQTQSTNANMEAGRSSWTFTITTAGTYGFRWWINVPSTTVNMTDFMLEKGNEVTSYTPYINIIKEQNGYVKENTTFYANDFKCRNLLPNNNTTQTINGVTFTVNSDKSVTVNGTATANTGFPLIGGVNIYDSLGLENNNYTLSGCPSGGSETGYSIYMGVKHSNSSVTNYYDIGNNVSFTKQTGDTIYAIIRVGNGTTVSNKTFYPQLEIGNETTSYVPFKQFDNKYETIPATDILTLSSGFSCPDASIKKQNNHYFGYVTITKSSKFTGSQETVASFKPRLSYNTNMYGAGGTSASNIYSIPSGLAYVYIGGATSSSNGNIYVTAPNTFEYVKFYLDVIVG